VLSEDFQDFLAGLEWAFRLRNLGSSGEQLTSDARIVALVAFPTMERAVKCPCQRAASVLSLKDVYGSVVFQEGADHRNVAVPRGVVQRGLVVFKGRLGRPASFEQELDGSRVVPYRCSDDAPGSIGGELLEELRMIGKDAVDGGSSPTSAALMSRSHRGLRCMSSSKTAVWPNWIAIMCGDLVIPKP
jgi:hypothetical protein